MRGLALAFAALAVLTAVLYGPVCRTVTILGIFRKPSPAVVAADEMLFRRIDDTMQCEDLHYYQPVNKLFAACEDSMLPRFEWMPPMGNFKKPSKARGSIHVIDPKTMKSTRLTFENFLEPFTTHGIEVVEDPANSNAVYIFAVNHPPNPEYYEKEVPSGDQDVPKCRSQIELFHHVLGSQSVRHVRSIRHPLVTTPNDIYASSPFSFYVTNDHFYREGILRTVEDAVSAAKWSNIIHVQIEELESASDPESGLHATVALQGLQTPNGLGHGKSNDEMLIVSAMGGILYRALPNENNHTISIVETIPMDSQIDNPAYFVDPYRTSDDDASGYLVPGLPRPIDVAKTLLDPSGKDGVLVWYVRPSTQGDVWERRLLFEDDGTNLRSVSTAVLVPIDPKDEEGGKKKAWLFVTGFYSEGMIAVKVDL